MRKMMLRKLQITLNSRNLINVTVLLFLDNAMAGRKGPKTAAAVRLRKHTTATGFCAAAGA